MKKPPNRYRLEGLGALCIPELPQIPLTSKTPTYRFSGALLMNYIRLTNNLPQFNNYKLCWFHGCKTDHDVDNTLINITLSGCCPITPNKIRLTGG